MCSFKSRGKKTCEHLIERMYELIEKIAGCSSENPREYDPNLCPIAFELGKAVSKGYDCSITEYCKTLGIGTECVSDQEILYTPYSGGDAGSGIYANKITSCRATKYLSSTYTKADCRSQSIKDNACYSYGYIRYNTEEDPSSLGNNNNYSYKLGNTAYYTYKKAIVIKKPPTVTPSGFLNCNSMSHDIPYSFERRTYVYNCSSLEYECILDSSFLINVKRTQGGSCNIKNRVEKTFAEMKGLDLVL